MANHPNRSKFSTDGAGRVTVTYTCQFTGELRSRTFTCPFGGGYVVELFRDGSSSQVCDGLGYRGPTLTAVSRVALPGLVRREYRAMRRAEARVLAGN